MSEHYYERHPTSESNPTFFNAILNTFTFTFQTDDGVFSKKQIDYGTKALLAQFKQPKVMGEFLDVGCGYGPIGITLAKQFPERSIVMVDVNERAIHLTQENIELNDLENAKVRFSDGLSTVKDEQFASVVTNPPFRAGKKVVHQIMEESFDVLKPGGELWVVVQKKQGAPSLKNKLESLFSQVETVNKDKGYYILRAKKFD